MSPQGTLGAIKAARAAVRQSAVETLTQELRAYARQHHGRFWLYGSAARTDMRDHSDIDILVDFPEDADAEAWDFAEAACHANGLKPDLMRRAWCKQRFLDAVLADAVEVD